MSTPRFTVYVDRPVLTTESVCMVVLDEADLKAQLDAHEAELRAAPYQAKIDKDPKTKQAKLYRLGEGWDLP
jgi:hypothetical protein